jgi:phosphatidylserine/phosphatidylglycerophosphate/cardiolipin synthase-like enzyme
VSDRAVPLLLGVLLLGCGVVGPAHAADGAAPSVSGVYPNPVAPGDEGEFVLVEFPRETNLTGWTLTDDDGTARPANRTVRGPVALTTDPRRVRARLDYAVVGLEGDLALSNAGERVVLRYRGEAVDSLAYRDAPAAERFDGESWRPLGATSFPVSTVRNLTVRPFALPDAPGVVGETLAGAERRLLLAGYTFRSRRATDLLAAAARRGATVRVLVEGGPVGGVGRREARLLEELTERGVAVRVLDGPLARYRYHHPKYAVVDDRALVTSENWGAGGTGGHGTRGWGVVARNATLADRLAAVFRADAGWRDAIPWRAYRANHSVQPASPPANDSYPTRFPVRTRSARSVDLVLAPENAERAVGDLLASAEESLLIAQPRTDPDHPFVRAAIRAARRGVSVRILLGSAWYEVEENRATARRLREVAARDGLDLSVKLVEPRSRFDRLHVKGVVVDREVAYVGSLNWNNVSVRENREVGLIVRGPAAGYYARVFRADWRGGAWRLPAGALLAVVGGLGGVAALLRRSVSFR